MSYRDYFDIDPEYFPQVDKQIIESVPDLWKKFYPHPSFVSLLKSTVTVLKRKQKLSIWVDGAYGTGKSHAVLTLKKLLEASEEETNAYFNKYKNNLDTFLLKDFVAQKNSGKILVCHRYGSSDISNDSELIVAIQESIEKSLAENGYDNQASLSLKKSLIRYFENDENRRSFNVFAEGSYRDVLGGDRAEDILDKLKKYEDESLRALISKIFKVPAVKGTFSMNTAELCDWIREIIEKYNLYSLFFIWDEFSEYFENNLHHLTGFQQIVDLSGTAPFCLMIVTHKAEAYFSDRDPDKRKILDRFVSPTVHISLPENIAFALMHEAMKVTEDENLALKWERNKASLDSRTMNSRNAVKKRIGLSDTDLSNVLPIHPYAALILQHISIYYTSTARSMFNFIKNDEGDEIQAFQWFIDHYDFSSENPFITIDMLWSFFYESGQDKLASGIKEVLSCYTRLNKGLVDQEQRVLKTILLLQAVSDRMTGNRDIFLPNDSNLILAFEGTNLEFSAPNIAKKMLRDHVITRTPLTGEIFSYCCKNTGASVDYEPYIKDAKEKSTKDMTFMTGSGLRNIVELSGALKARYNVSYVTLSDFENEIKKLNNPESYDNKINALVTIAKDDTESVALQKKIKLFYEEHSMSDVVVIDTSNTTFNENDYNEFIENYAMSLAIGSSDITQRKTYDEYALASLKKWANKIKTGDFYIYSRYSLSGERVTNSSDLFDKLKEINKIHYPRCLEVAYPTVLVTLYDVNSINSGAQCGINEETKGLYRSSNEATKLENLLKDAWKLPDYWKKNHSYIATIKNDIENAISDVFSKHDRVSISHIYNILKAAPYGFMPCNFTAFIMGFVLKEYANGVYSYSDDKVTEPLDTEKLAAMINDIIRQEITPNKRYADKYIVKLTDSEKAFNKATSEIFGIDLKQCVSVTGTRARIRAEMKNFVFPIWLIKYSLGDVHFKTSKRNVEDLIDNYCAIANNQNDGRGKSDNDIALEIGESCLNNQDLIDDIKMVMTKDNCKQGMLNYLKDYKDGELTILSESIEDGGQYINRLADKFETSDASNWVWSKDTVHNVIDELLTEYKIIDYSNQILAKSSSYSETIKSWCDKIGQIKLAYSVISSNLGESKDFFSLLRDLKKSNKLLNSQKNNFLDLLQSNIDEFKRFMASQSEIFMKSCFHYIDGLYIEDIKSMLDDDKYDFKGSYISEPNVYIEKVQKAVASYKSSLAHIQLKKQWKELTGTESPFDWSNKYCMPIMAMVPEVESELARTAFDVFNSKVKSPESVKNAIDYLSKVSYVDKLNSPMARDKAFVDIFLNDYSVLLNDVEGIKEYLRKHSSEHPYYWMGSKAILTEIKSLANSKYMEIGYEKAKQIIDCMPAEQVKKYLKQLIEENVVVGIEILKGQK